MKATINGITVEGTPQEIMEYQQMQAEKAEKPWTPVTPWIDKKLTIDSDWVKGLPKITSGDPHRSIGNGSTMGKRCDHTCYCTGECQSGRTALSGLNTYDYHA